MATRFKSFEIINQAYRHADQRIMPLLNSYQPRMMESSYKTARCFWCAQIWQQPGLFLNNSKGKISATATFSMPYKANVWILKLIHYLSGI